MALALAGSRAQAQPTVLQDADLPGLVTVLRADVARTSTQGRAATTIGREIRADIDATVARSQADPLPQIQARTSHFVLPPDARYSAACSRATSTAFMAPRLVYAVGQPDTASEAALRGKDPKALTQKEILDVLVRQSRGSAARAFEATVRFYQARGFAISGTVDSKAILRWKGAADDPLVVAVFLANENASYDRSCARLGNTALLVLAAHEEARASDAATTAQRSIAQGEAAFASALARAGMTQDRYASLLDAAWQALRELQDPQQAEEADALARLPMPDMRALGESRRRNRAWLARHRAELEPAIEAYARAIEGHAGR